MKDRKLSPVEADAFWKQTHGSAGSDLQAVCFPDKSQALNEFFDRIQRYALRRALNELAIVGAQDRVLEIGSGRGRWLRFFADRGAIATGVDISPEAVARSVDAGLTALVGSAEELPFATASFDVVVSITVLLHLPPDAQRQAIAEVERVCRPGGHVVLLEGSAPRDSAVHVWSHPVRDWVGLFNVSRPIFIESHYFVFPLRIFWRLPPRVVPMKLRRLAEAVTLRLAWPLELFLMRISHRRTTRAALQSLIVLRTPR
jgi:SAM-dependent methyltransferase